MKKLLLPTTIMGLMLVLAACGGAAQPAAPAAAIEQSTGAPTIEPTATSALTVQSAAEPTTAPDPTAELVEQPTTAPTEGATAGATVSDPDTATSTIAIANTKLNLNEATGDDYLAAIPGFSSRMVREFLEYRPYISIQQFRREIGKYVDDATVAGYEQYVYVPVDVNESDAETLQQLLGVDDAIAAELIAARPYDSNEAFLAALTQLVAADDVAAAAGYLQAQ